APATHWSRPSCRARGDRLPPAFGRASRQAAAPVPPVPPSRRSIGPPAWTAISQIWSARFHPWRPDRYRSRRRQLRSYTSSGTLLRCIDRQALLAIMRASFRGTPHSRSPAAAAGRAYLDAIAWTDFDTDLLGAHHARLAPYRSQLVALRRTVLPAQPAAGAL